MLNSVFVLLSNLPAPNNTVLRTIITLYYLGNLVFFIKCDLLRIASVVCYLGPLVPVHSLPGSRSLRSTGTNRLLVPSVKRSTVGSRAFPVAGPKTWNALPEDVTSS